MDKDELYNEEQEKKLTKRINEIKNQVINDNTSINPKEQPIENNTIGIENVVVYKDNAKKTMKGKSKTKLVAAIVAGAILLGGIGAVAAKQLQPTEEELYQKRISSLITVDSNHMNLLLEPGKHSTYIYVEINPDDYSSADFMTTDLYYRLYEEKVKKAWEDGYDPLDPNDVFCIYDYTEPNSTLFDAQDEQPYFPRYNGSQYYYTYFIRNNVYMILPVEIDSEGEITDDTYFKPGIACKPVSNPSLEAIKK